MFTSSAVVERILEVAAFELNGTASLNNIVMMMMIYYQVMFLQNEHLQE